MRQLRVGGEGKGGRRDWRKGAWVEVELVEVGRQGDRADLLPGAGAGAADGIECTEVALMKTKVTQSTKISGLKVGQKVAKMHFLAKAKMELVEVGREGDGADLLPGAGAADGIECTEVALMKTKVTQSTEIKVGLKVAKIHFLAKARMVFLTKEAVRVRADMA